MEPNALFKRFTVVLFVSALFCTRLPLAQEPSKLVDDFKALSAARQQQLQQLFPKSRDTTSAAQLANATVLSELAINKRAADLGITASDAEVETFLVPPLSRQGLVNVASLRPIRTDMNVRRWLNGQHWTMDQLFEAGRTLLLWVKIAMRDSTATSEEVQAFVAKHPEVYQIQERVQLTLTRFDLPANANRLVLLC